MKRNTKLTHIWKCGCETDGNGEFIVCSIFHDNLLSEALNSVEEQDDLLRKELREENDKSKI